jgi:ferredoxin-NADP reductase
LPSTKTLFNIPNDKNWSGFYLSQEDTLPAWWHAGRIDLGLDDALAFLETSDISVFICGKPEMVDAMREKLQVAWIDESNICFEKY